MFRVNYTVGPCGLQNFHAWYPGFHKYALGPGGM